MLKVEAEALCVQLIGSVRSKIKGNSGTISPGRNPRTADGSVAMPLSTLDNTTHNNSDMYQ
jgi:hypothetical protein